MGVRCVRAVLERSQARGAERMVLVDLAERADDKTGTCYPSVATIAKESAITERAAQLAIRALVSAGELEVVEHGAPMPKVRQQHRPNLYRLRLVVNDTSPLNPALVVNPASPLKPSSGEKYDIPVVNPSSPKPKEEPLRTRATDDPLTERAHKLTVLAFEQTPKPLPSFAAVLAIIKAALVAGYTDQEAREAITGRHVTVWTRPGFEVGLSRAKRQPQPESYGPEAVSMI